MRRIFGAVLCVGIALGALQSASVAQEAKERFRIGGLLALSGPLGILGEDARKGMDLAIAARVSELFGGTARLKAVQGQGTAIVLDWPVRIGSQGTL